MKVITNPTYNIPQLRTSHVLGWSQVWSDQLNASINHKCDHSILNADEIYIDHGVNFGGTLNLFGGASKQIFDNINRVFSHSNVTSLDFDMPDLGSQLKKRIGANTTYEGITEEWCDKLSARLKNVPSLKQENLKLDGITVGDSHSPAYSRKNDVVLRTNGKTLFGQLKLGLKEAFRGMEPNGEITFCYGSIDIRHHMLRHEDNLENTIVEYVKQGDEFGDVKYAAPVPVEYEERKIPKSGFYKGTPFYGTRQERYDLTMRFIDLLDKHSNGRVVMPPKEWYTMNPEKYAKTYMENNSSFHIAPPYYRRNDWGTTCLM
ncbi:hypothetical protein [Limnobacter sp.]|uniref:hypothetical protein n=1 Tax=Limnobacter sp. TaxID=2003368 RepID=UPI00311F2345